MPESPVSLVTVGALLTLLGDRGGQEVAVRLYSAAGQGRTRPARELGRYLLTKRGEQIQVTGPSGQTRQLSGAAFLEMFSSYLFGQLQPTGHLTDLGPLFQLDAD